MKGEGREKELSNQGTASMEKGAEMSGRGGEAEKNLTRKTMPLLKGRTGNPQGRIDQMGKKKKRRDQKERDFTAREKKKKGEVHW